jgi:hypothetical protein
MRSFAAVLRLELYEKRFMLFLGAGLAVLLWLLPLVPGLTRLAPAELRSVSSLLIGLGFAFGGALLAGASLFGPDLASGRISFPLSRPISSIALVAGRLVAAAALVAAATLLILVPALLTGNAAEPVLHALPLWLALLLSLLLLLSANAASVALRSRSSWLAIDAALTPIAAVVVWLASRRLLLAGAERMLRASLVGLGTVLAVALLLAMLAQVALGRTDRLSAHGALSLTLWAIAVPAAVAFDLFSRWAVAPTPADLERVSVTSVAPNGAWVAVSGTAAHRAGLEASFLLDTASGRYVRLGPGASVAFSEDGRHAVVQRATSGVSRTPTELELVDLDAPRPVRHDAGITVPASSWASLALTPDGRRATVLAEGTLNVFDLGSKKLLAAAATGASVAEMRIRFVGADRVLIVPATHPRHAAGEKTPEPAGRARLPISVFDVVLRKLATTGTIDATTPSWFQASADGTRLLESEPAARRVSVLDAGTGATRPGCVFEGFARGAFLADGRVALVKAGAGGGRLAIARADCGIASVTALPPARALWVASEPEPGTLAIGALRGEVGRPETSLLLVDVGTGAVREIRGARPAGGIWFALEPPAAAGSPASRLLTTSSGALVSLDPRSGATRTVLAGPSP